MKEMEEEYSGTSSEITLLPFSPAPLDFNLLQEHLMLSTLSTIQSVMHTTSLFRRFFQFTYFQKEHHVKESQVSTDKHIPTENTGFQYDDCGVCGGDNMDCPCEQ